MTIQIGDFCKFNNVWYTILAASKEIPFSPSDYGISSDTKCTACWRGHWCEYEVSAKKFLLQNLHTFCSNNEFPPINGVEVDMTDAVGFHVYRNIELKIPYTGKILLGDDFLKDQSRNLYLDRQWAYDKLVELVFVNGYLVKSKDRSRIGKKIRRIMQQEIGNFDSNLSFSIKNNKLKKIKGNIEAKFRKKAWWV